MEKYINRIKSEFENILVQLSYNLDTSFCEAVAEAGEYARNFAAKKHLTQSEEQEALELCLELVQDWFPDTTQIVYAQF